MDITARILTRDDNGRTRWDLKVNDTTFHFWDARGVQEFTIPKYTDNELTGHLRALIKQQLQTKTVQQIITYLSTPRNLRINYVGYTVEEI